MTTLPTYEGWSNYPTWAVNLWLHNDEPLYNALMSFVRSWTDQDRYVCAERLKLWVESDLVPDLGASLAADLQGWALAYVDWQELADHYIGDYL